MRNIKPLKKPVIASSVSSSGERKAFSFVLLSAGMLSIPAWRGVGCFDDTVQYIAMHIRRETVYPLYLAFSRLFFGSSDQPGVTGKAGLMVSTSQWELFGLDFYPGIAASTNHLSLASCSVSPISHPPDSEHTGRGRGSDCGARDCHGGTATGSRYSERSPQTL